MDLYNRDDDLSIVLTLSNTIELLKEGLHSAYLLNHQLKRVIVLKWATIKWVTGDKYQVCPSGPQEVPKWYPNGP